MRLWLFLCTFSVILTVALAWSDLDHEIFDLVSDIENSEGKGTTFYSWLDVPHTASSSVISKAYHKNPGVKNIQKRFARLGVVAEILRNPESRERYDFFYKNGVPKWRGTGYYYSRYRPGLASVVVFLVILTSGMQYTVQRLNHKRDLARIQRFMASARSAAWGPKLIPVKGQRKVKVSLGGGFVGGEEDEYIPGKTLDMVVDGDEVFIVEPDGSLLLLDESAASPASLRSTWFASLVKSLYYVIRNRQRGTSDDKASAGPAPDSSDSSESESVPSRSQTQTPVNGGEGGHSKSSHTASLVGGRRRKPKRK